MKYRITSGFGDREIFRSSPHTGIDFKMESGEPLRSISSGIVHIRDYGDMNAGKTIIIESSDGKKFIYGHLSDFNVLDDQFVKAGDLIGYSGNSGNSTGAHLHFGLKENGQFVDPSSYIESIQHMNDSNFIAQSASHMKVNFFDYMQQHMDLIGGFISNVKLNLIHLLTSTDYSPVIQLLKGIVQFIFLNT